MLEVKNLTKIYTPKDGVPVKALDKINLAFPEKGMVFLLGKSGSGKSTLLNVCGGLDSPSKGEIIVKGRSSKSFSPSDFDSYRNTFIGFIFQEYNILEDFSVEDNIALALELQNKPHDKAAVAHILSQVDLEGFENRDPKTLSGGEKQRIAIARALIKNPEIIMADEPSGALDSATGRQVFETLKKLSLDKLVIVVSHDRDFAESYGDRIIELKDGEIISDLSKVEVKDTENKSNVTFMENIVCVKNAAELNDKDFEEIKDFLKKSKGDVIIASGEKQVTNFKRQNSITETGSRKIFKASTEESPKSYKPEDCKLIPSTLPLKHAIKMGLSSLKGKPFRLAFTAILCIAAFTLFGLLSTISLYSKRATFEQSISNSDQTTICLNKEYSVEVSAYQDKEFSGKYKEIYKSAFTKKEIEEFKKEYGDSVFGGIETSNTYVVHTTNFAYWQNKIDSLAFMEEDNPLYKTIKGKYPKAADEICISSYTAEVLFNCKTYDEGRNIVSFKKVEDVIGEKISVTGKYYKITGIFDSGAIPEKFDEIKNEYENSADKSLLYELETFLEEGLHFVAFLSEDSIKSIAAEKSNDDFERYYYQSMAANINAGTKTYLPSTDNANYAAISKKMDGIKINYLNENKTELKENEIILYEDIFYESVAKLYDIKKRSANGTATANLYGEIVALCSHQLEGGEWDFSRPSSPFIEYTESQKAQNLEKILAALKRDKIELTLSARVVDRDVYEPSTDKLTLKVIGVWSAGKIAKKDTTVYVSDSFEKALWKKQKKTLEAYEEYKTKYIRSASAFYTEIFLPYDHSSDKTEKYGKIFANEKYGDDDSIITLAGDFAENLEAVDYTVKQLSRVFLLSGIALAVFAALLLSNFISVSIYSKNKEIGILRAVGAKGSDVFKIFFAETAVIVIACILVSTVLSIIICNMINNVLAANIGAELFVFSILSFVLLVLIALVTAILATYFPVNNAAKKKPIESIRSI